jgi:thioesterase domain-containing protein/acyl carrier protein
LGRRDHQVKVRGYRVELREIENVLLNLPGVREATVVAERRGDETELIGFVVADPSLADADALRAPLRAALPAWKIPARLIRVADALPLTHTGKVDRQALRQLVDAQPKPDVKPAASTADRLERQILDIWTSLLGRGGFDVDDDFFEVGGTSLAAAELLAQIERQFGRKISIPTLLKQPTVSRLAAVLRADAPTTVNADSHVVRLKEGSGPRPPLVCVPMAHGSALTYMPLARLLDEGQPVVALEFSDDVNHADDRVEQTAAKFVAQLRREFLRGPYRLCGHSYGAVLAFEMARQLVAAGCEVGLLAMLDGVVPGSQRPLPAIRRAPLHVRRLVALGARGAWRDLSQRVIARDAKTPEAAGGALPTPNRRTHAFRRYRPGRYDGTITLLRAVEPLASWQFFQPQPFNGWDAVCDRVVVRDVPGDHLSMFKEPHLRQTAAVLNECLRQSNA